MNAYVALLASCFLLFGCDARVGTIATPDNNVILAADMQRKKVIEHTRAASYSVFPDTDDVAKLKDETFLDAMHTATANGSAFGVSADGLVMTNVHVIESTNFCTAPGVNEGDLRREEESATYCLLVNQAFTKVFRAKVVKMDKENDIAVMRIEHSGETFPFLTLAAPGSFGEGTEVLTVGSPLGNMNFTTPGLISNLDFMKQDKETGKKGVRKIQFSAAILPGNSGGPLVSIATGKVVGQVVAIIMIHNIPTQMSYANPVEFLHENIRAVKKETPQ